MNLLGAAPPALPCARARHPASRRPATSQL